MTKPRADNRVTKSRIRSISRGNFFAKLVSARRLRYAGNAILREARLADHPLGAVFVGEDFADEETENPASHEFPEASDILR